MTLSRFTTVIRRPATSTVTRSCRFFSGTGHVLQADVVGGQVGSTPAVCGLPEPALVGESQRLHLADQNGVHERGAERVLPRDDAGERRVGEREAGQLLGQSDPGLAGDAAADPAEVAQTLRTRSADEYRSEPVDAVGLGPPATDEDRHRRAV